MKYEKAYAEVVMLDNSDVVTASGCLDKTSFTQDCDQSAQQSWCGNGHIKQAVGAMNSENFWG